MSSERLGALGLGSSAARLRPRPQVARCESGTPGDPRARRRGHATRHSQWTADRRLGAGMLPGGVDCCGGELPGHGTL